MHCEWLFKSVRSFGKAFWQFANLGQGPKEIVQSVEKTNAQKYPFLVAKRLKATEMLKEYTNGGQFLQWDIMGPFQILWI